MERKEQAKAQVRDQASRKEEAFIAQQKELDIIQKELTGIRRLNEMLEKSSGKEMVLTEVKKQKRVIDDCIQEIDAKRRKIDSQLTQIDGSFISTIDITPFKRSIFNPANCELLFPECLYVNRPVSAILYTRDSLGNLCAHCSDVDVDNEVYVELETTTGKVVHAEIEDNDDGSYKATFTPRHIGKAKLAASINGQQVKGSPYDVTVNSNFGITKIDSNCIDGDSKQPWAIAIGRYGVWAVTDHHNHCVYLLNGYIPQQKYYNTYQMFKKLGSQGNDDGQFQNPCGVVFDSKNNLYVVDGNNHRIQKFDMRGNYLLQFGNKGTEVGQLSNPRGITVHNGRVYVADSGNKRVAVFQTTGQFCHNIGEQLLGVPCDITVSINTLLVAVYGQDCLNAFTLDGQSKGNFGTLHQSKSKTNKGTLLLYGQTSSKTDSIMYPYGLTTDLNGFVIVSETCSDHVEIFDKDGNLVKSLALNNTHVHGSVISAHSNSHTWCPLGVDISPEGQIWAVLAERSSIQKLVQDNFPIR